MKKLLILLCLILWTGRLYATTLSDAAAALSPGSWVELTTNGLVTGGVAIFDTPVGGSTNEYQDKAVWNPITNQFMYYGGAHCGSGAGTCPETGKFLVYTDSSNSWVGTLNEGGFAKGHTYQGNALNPNTGINYLADTAGGPIYQRTAPSTWSFWANRPPGSASCCHAIEYFPNRNTIIYVDGDWGIWEYQITGGTPIRLAHTNGGSGGGIPKLPMAAYQDVAVFSDVENSIVLGGGLNLYKMSSTGVFTTLATPPANVRVNESIFTVDPVSGRYLAFFNNSTFYEYNLASNVWTLQGSSHNPPFFTASADLPAQSSVCAPIPEYGVIMCATNNFANSKVYLYKHSPSTPPPPDTTSPSNPTGLSAVTTSASNVSLSWTASTDNVGVAGYRVERCTGTGCSSFAEIAQPAATTYPDGTVNAQTTIYRYRVRAVDGSNNFSGYSSAVESTLFTVTGTGNFSERCAAAGVVRCFGFDTAADFPDFAPGAGNNRCWGCNYGIGPNGSHVNIATLDTSIKASGAGSMKFVQPEGGNSSSAGNWFTNLSADKSFQLNEGGEVYVQYRWRASPDLLNNANWPSSDGFKLSDIAAGDNLSCTTSSPNTTNCPGSCTAADLITQNAGKTGFPKVYSGCSGPESFNALTKSTSGSIDYHPNWTGTPARTCYYPGPYGEPKCFEFAANEWMTFKMYVKVGNWKTYNSTVKLWVAREGQPSQLILHCGPGVACVDKLGTTHTTGMYIHNDATNSQRLGKVWLLPYQTNLSSGLTDASLWYDELIISTQDIADPSAVEGGSLVPTISQKRRRK